VKYNATNCLEAIKPEVVSYIKDNWQELADISNNSQRIFTRDYAEMISLSFDSEQNCSGIFIGTNHRERFDNMIDHLDVGWDYVSTEDEGEEEEGKLGVYESSAWQNTNRLRLQPTKIKFYYSNTQTKKQPAPLQKSRLLVYYAASQLGGILYY
jgi:hypothetical protein